MSTEKDIKEVTDSLCELIQEKNKRYGNAALDPINVFTKHDPLGFEIDKKLSRIQNSEELRKNDTVDVIGYLILLCIKKGWKCFKDQLD